MVESRTNSFPGKPLSLFLLPNLLQHLLPEVLFRGKTAESGPSWPAPGFRALSSRKKKNRLVLFPEKGYFAFRMHDGGGKPGVWPGLQEDLQQRRYYLSEDTGLGVVEVFFSVGSPHNDRQQAYIDNLVNYFRKNGIILDTLKEWDDSDPLVPIIKKLKNSCGCIVLALEPALCQ
ncbi:MAG: hypothetical protein IPN20_01105 [Haliscomenobacter sp.]|nr:hypothetical protein [Haliscomenobacter sp.]